MRPIPTSGPTEEPAPAHYDPGAEADRLISHRLNGDGDGRHPGDPEPDATSAALIPNHRTPAPADTVGGAPLSTSGDAAYRFRTRVEKLEQRPGWHGVLTPQPVSEAWAALLEALQSAQAAHHAVHGVNVAEAAHGKAEAEAIRSAARDGEPAPKAKAPQDWDAQRARHRATAAGLLDRATVARSAYDEAVTVALPEWRTELAAQVQPAHVKAAQALGQALQAYGALMGVIEAARAQGSSAGEDWRPLPQFDAGRQGIVRALDTLGKLDSSRPLTEPKIRPSRAERRAMAESGDLDSAWHLQRIEQREDFALTQHTRGKLIEKPVSISNTLL